MVVPKNFGKCCGVKMVDQTTSSILVMSPRFNACAVPWNVDMNRTALDIIFQKAVVATTEYGESSSVILCRMDGQSNFLSFAGHICVVILATLSFSARGSMYVIT
jgi:hypothetical protein